ncbi:hypothetical protein [Nostoc sp.]
MNQQAGDKTRCDALLYETHSRSAQAQGKTCGGKLRNYPIIVS